MNNYVSLQSQLFDFYLQIGHELSKAHQDGAIVVAKCQGTARQIELANRCHLSGGAGVTKF